MSQTVKIFYSWQSDLPAKDTKNFIGDAIEAAAKFLANTVTVIPDRDTKNETGSPNIEQTIFNKIEECDLFVGDLSLVASYENKNGTMKYTPNPNVLVELGYAVKVLGWQNIICFVNKDFGEEADLPFDLNHHRVTGYSLENNERADVRKGLRDVIASTVMTLMENGIRPKNGFSSHIIGAYDFISKNVIEKLIPFDIQNSNFVINYKEYILQELREKLNAAISIVLPSINENIKNFKDSEVNSGIIETGGRNHKELAMPKIDLVTYKKVEISDKDQEELRNNVKQYFGIELDKDFFDFGDLTITTGTIAELIGVEQKGTDEAKKKYCYVQNCMEQLKNLKLFEEYLKTFKDTLFFPLAIWNKSIVTDKDISVSVIVDEDTAEVVMPDEKLIDKNVAEMAGLIYEKQFLEFLLKMPDTSDIVDGSDFEMQNSAELRRQVASNIPTPFGYSYRPEYDLDDYVDEIQKYIATPIETSYNEFDFHNKKLRPNEKNWLGKGILLKPKASKVTMTYRITSEHSDGNLGGILEYNLEKNKGEK